MYQESIHTSDYAISKCGVFLAMASNCHYDISMTRKIFESLPRDLVTEITGNKQFLVILIASAAF